MPGVLIMKWLLFAALAFVGAWLAHRQKPDVSHAWRIDHERRQWGKGNEEQVRWKWPVDK